VKALAKLAPADRLHISGAVIRHAPPDFGRPSLFDAFVACLILDAVE
jgi:hypothetical protein